MIERPILFSAPMVRAVLADRKTQTRRVIKPQPKYPGVEKFVFELHPFAPSCLAGTPAEGMKVGPERKVWQYEDWCGNIVGVHGDCPYGQVGDRLWVKETFYHDPDFHGQPQTWYRADDEISKGWSWKPSIFMPRRLSRLTLEITDIRVERVQDISEEDAKAEGIHAYQSIVNGQTLYTGIVNDHRPGKETAKDAFRDLWDSINAKRDGGIYSWESNPWVWAITFKRI